MDTGQNLRVHQIQLPLFTKQELREPEKVSSVKRLHHQLMSSCRSLLLSPTGGDVRWSRKIKEYHSRILSLIRLALGMRQDKET